MTYGLYTFSWGQISLGSCHGISVTLPVRLFIGLDKYIVLMVRISVYQGWLLFVTEHPCHQPEFIGQVVRLPER